MSRVEDQVADSIHGAGGKVREKAAEVAHNLRDVGNQVRDSAQHKMEEVKDKANEYYNQGRDMAHEWEKGLESYVQRKPLEAVLIAAGVGIVLGLIWRRR